MIILEIIGYVILLLSVVGVSVFVTLVVTDKIGYKAAVIFGISLIVLFIVGAVLISFFSVTKYIIII